MPEDHAMILPQTGMITFLPNIAVASNIRVGTNIQCDVSPVLNKVPYLLFHPRPSTQVRVKYK